MAKMLKVFLWMAAMSYTVALAAADDVRAYFVPERAQCGVPFELVLEADSAGLPVLAQKIDNIDIIDFSRYMQVQNGVVKAAVRYRCVADKPGKMEIPPLTVRVGTDIRKTNKLTLVVEEVKPLTASATGSAAAELESGAPLVTRWILPDNRTKFYVGELVPAELRLYVRLDRIGLSGLSYPRLDLGKALVTDFSPINREDSHFAPPTESDENIKGCNYHVVSFRTSFRPLAAGKVGFSAVQEARVLENGFRQVSSKLNYTSPEVTVEALPPPPEDAIPLGLVGKWQIAFSQNAFQAPVGGSVKLTLTITGDGPMEFFNAPALAIDKCRVLPGDLWTQPGYNYSRLSYAVVPLSEGAVDEKLRFSTFDPIAGKYEIAEYEFKLKATPGEAVGIATVNSAPPEAESAADAPKGPSPLEPRTLLKSRRGGAVELPLWYNNIGWTVGFLVAGPVLLGVFEWLRRRAIRRRNSPELIRRDRASGNRRLVLRRLKNASPEEFAKVVNTALVPFLNDAMNLPPGTDASGIADKTADRELAEQLRKAAELGYLPDSASDRERVAKLRNDLLRAVKRATVVFLVFAASFSASGQWSDGCNSLSNGEAAPALAAFERMYNPSEPEPNLLFNLGSSAYLANNYPLALWAFEQAHLLAPRDHEIVDSLNALRRRFFIPEVGTNSTTGALAASLRDGFRPDEYLLAAAVVVFLVFLLLLFRRKIGKWQLRFSAAGGLLAAALLAGIAGWQFSTSYRPGMAMVVKNSALLRTLPSDSTNVNGVPLSGGTRVEVEDERDGFAKVRANGQTGYLRADEFRKLL